MRFFSPIFPDWQGKTCVRRSLLAALCWLAVLGGGAAAAVEAEHGMVVSAQHYASEIGAGILAQGGNAIDAAVAVGYALAVVDPCCGNIGGGGFMTIRLKDGRDTFINFRETAPAAATAAMYLDAGGQPIADLSRWGYRAAGVPGTVLGLERAASEYGRLARRALLAPAIALARDGFVLGPGDTDILDGKRVRQGSRRCEDLSAARRQPLCAGRPPRPNRPRGDARKDRGARPRRLLQRPDRGGGREGEHGERRHPDRAGFRRLHGNRGTAAQLLLPRLPDPLGAAAELGRDGDLRNPRHPRRLRSEGAGLPLGAVGAPAGRGDAPRLPRPQHLSRRPGLRAEPTGAPAYRRTTPPRSAR